MTIAVPDAYRSVGLGLAITSAIACVYLVTLITQLFAGRSPGSSTYSTLGTVRILAVLDALLLIRNHLTADTYVLAGIVSQFLLVANCMLNAVITLDVFRSVRDLFAGPELWFWRHVASALTVAAVTALVPVAYQAYSRRGQQSEQAAGSAALRALSTQCCSARVCAVVAFSRHEAARRAQKAAATGRAPKVAAPHDGLCGPVRGHVVAPVDRAHVLVGRGWPACHGTAIRVVARWMTSSIGIVDATTWYGPVCAAAARERARVEHCCTTAAAPRMPGAGLGTWQRGPGPARGVGGELGQLTPNPALAADPTADEVMMISVSLSCITLELDCRWRI